MGEKGYKRMRDEIKDGVRKGRRGCGIGWKKG